MTTDELKKEASGWVSVDERKPLLDMPILLWGSKLDAAVDHPLPGKLCACHEQWVLDNEPDDEDTNSHTARMMGEVTHWLDWRIGLPSPPEGGEHG